MPSIFTRIVNGEIPCHKVAEDERFLAFLDIEPLREGHTLVIPKREVDRLFDLPDEDLSGILLFARGVARRIEAVVPCERVGLTVIGLEVPHAHIHLVPINGIADMEFSRPRAPMSNEALAATAERLRNA
ncbi:MAG: HIT family protein [Flavobacteriales bacterium]|nr:HIT family protein [Flavobacteriales bacterium]